MRLLPLGADAMKQPTLTRRRTGGIGFDRAVIDPNTRDRWPRWVVAAMSAALGFLAGVAFVLLVAP
jgi:hypothetical protein